jgi:hypothetical protein
MSKSEELDESELSKKLNAQIEETVQIEKELSLVVKQRDLCKRKAEQIQRLKEGFVFSFLQP